jgi:hypothetical protein
MTSQTPLPTRVSKACDRCRRNKSRVGISGLFLYVTGIALTHISSSATRIGRVHCVCVRASTALPLAAQLQYPQCRLAAKQVLTELNRYLSRMKRRRIVGNADGRGRETIILVLKSHRPRRAQRGPLSGTAIVKHLQSEM